MLHNGAGGGGVSVPGWRGLYNGFVLPAQDAINPIQYLHVFHDPSHDKRYIPAGTELTYDYQYRAGEGTQELRCCCGTAKCRGRLL